LVHCEPLFNVAGKAETRNANWIVFGFIFSRDRANTPNTAWVRARLCRLQKRCTRLAVASDKVYQLLAHGRWFSPGTTASSTTKTGRHDIVEILLKVALSGTAGISPNRVLPRDQPQEEEVSRDDSSDNSVNMLNRSNVINIYQLNHGNQF
jgi:hypothetical protein